jgi:hypothetical protein
VPLFAPLAPLRWFACFSAPIAALRLPAPPRRSLFALLRGSPFGEETGAPKFLGNPCPACPVLRLRWNLLEQASGTSSLRFALSVSPSEPRDSSASTTDMISEPDHAACMLAVYASCRSLPSVHARLASGWRPCLRRAGLEPAELLILVSVLLGYMTHLQDETLLGALEGPWSLRQRTWTFAARCAHAPPI